MAASFPKPETARFAAIEPTLVVQSYLSTVTQGLSRPKLRNVLKSILAPAEVDKAADALVASGTIEEKTKLRISNDKRDVVRKSLGRDAGRPWDKLVEFRFPVLALGLNADDPSVRKALRPRGALQAAIVGVAYGLPRDALRSAEAVRSELVWRVLRAALGDVVGNGPFPLIDKSNAIDRTIIGGLAGVRPRTINEATAALAAKLLGVRGTQLEALRRELINIAVKKVVSAGADGFAERVKEVARLLSTPPFQGRVAIAQVYDEYGRAHPDAGSLESFKQRLVAAAKARSLDLSRLDLPEHMSGELRNRSKTQWGSDELRSRPQVPDRHWPC
jgi:hypothetical protein